MSYVAQKSALDTGTWLVNTDGDKDLCVIARGLTKPQAMRIAHFMNGGSTVQWPGIQLITGTTGNFDDGAEEESA